MHQVGIVNAFYRLCSNAVVGGGSWGRGLAGFVHCMLFVCRTVFPSLSSPLPGVFVVRRLFVPFYARCFVDERRVLQLRCCSQVLTFAAPPPPSLFVFCVAEWFSIEHLFGGFRRRPMFDEPHHPAHHTRQSNV